MQDTLKSVFPVLNQKHGWIVRVRTQSGREVFLGMGARYTMAQAQVYADSIRRDAARHGIDAAIA